MNLEPPDESCPQCGSGDFGVAGGGDKYLCQSCGAHYRPLPSVGMAIVLMLVGIPMLAVAVWLGVSGVRDMPGVTLGFAVIIGVAGAMVLRRAIIDLHRSSTEPSQGFPVVPLPPRSNDSEPQTAADKPNR